MITEDNQTYVISDEEWLRYKDKEKEMLDDEIKFLERLFEDLTTDFPHYGFKLKENERILERLSKLKKRIEQK
jgi:hypothetical protein